MTTEVPNLPVHFAKKVGPNYLDGTELHVRRFSERAVKSNVRKVSKLAN